MSNIPLKSITFPGLGNTYTIPEIDTTLSVTGKAADSKKTGDEISQIKADLEDLDERVDALESGGSGLTDAVKTALLQLAQKVAYIDDDGQDYYYNLYDALYPPADLVSISAVYTQSGSVYDTDSLDSLKSDLVVTANYSDSTTITLSDSDYTLRGTLEVGTSTITVAYGGKTTTFNVTVTGDVDYNQESLWEVGGLNSNGTNTTSTSRLRTIDYISSAVKKVSVDDGYSYILVCYNSGGTVLNGTKGYYNPNTNAMTNVGVYYTGEIVLDDIASVIGDYNNIKVLMRNEQSSSSAITISEALKLHLKG